VQFKQGLQHKLKIDDTLNQQDGKVGDDLWRYGVIDIVTAASQAASFFQQLLFANGDDKTLKEQEACEEELWVVAHEVNEDDDTEWEKIQIHLELETVSSKEDFGSVFTLS